jgi:hypothetical protein
MMPTLFRSMRMEADKLPECGNTARQLGARQGKDIPVCANGKVDPTTGGMSVAAGSPNELAPHRRPALFEGSGKDPVFTIHSDRFPSSLVVRQSGKSRSHHLVEPSQQCLYLVFQEALCSTRYSWEEVVQ